MSNEIQSKKLSVSVYLVYILIDYTFYLFYKMCLVLDVVVRLAELFLFFSFLLHFHILYFRVREGF